MFYFINGISTKWFRAMEESVVQNSNSFKINKKMRMAHNKAYYAKTGQKNREKSLAKFSYPSDL